MDQKQMESIIEGILFTFGEAVEPSRIAKALEVETKRCRKGIGTYERNVGRRRTRGCN